MRLRWNYRHSPFFVIRRLNRTAGHLNVFLLVMALGLAALDLIYAGKMIADDLPLRPAITQHAGIQNW